jgi:diguanylate cyclase (GGDEF)-like protein
MTKPFAMIIEDDRDIVALFRHVLDLAGFITEIVLRGEKATERLEITRPELVLLDLNLTGVPGTEILKKIRSSDRLKDTTVIVVTGYPQMAAGLQSDTELILHKPVSLDLLYKLIKRFHPFDTAALSDPPHDEITSLYHRSFFINRLSYSVEHTHRMGGAIFGVMFIDCDNFSIVQQKGKDFANRVLVETAKLLKTVVRPYDTISHFNSGQFFIQVEDLPTKDILHRIAERVHSNLTKRILDAFGFEMTANIGMVFCGSEYRTPEEIIRDVDIAMFYAKSTPHTNLVIFNPLQHGSFRSPEKYIAIKRVDFPVEDLIKSQEE